MITILYFFFSALSLSRSVYFTHENFINPILLHYIRHIRTLAQKAYGAQQSQCHGKIANERNEILSVLCRQSAAVAVPVLCEIVPEKEACIHIYRIAHTYTTTKNG